MPIYEYKCRSCTKNFEVIALSSSSMEGLPKCPKCGNNKVKKLISYVVTRPNGIPKGSGGFTGPACKRNSSFGGG